MKIEQRELLDDLLNDQSFEGFNSGLRTECAAAFIRGQRARKARTRLAAAVVVIGAVFVFWPRQPLAPPHPALSAFKDAPKKAEKFLLSDEELLSYFPAGAASLVQVDGKSFLVFSDKRLKEQYLVGAKGGKPGS